MLNFVDNFRIKGIMWKACSTIMWKGLVKICFIFLNFPPVKRGIEIKCKGWMTKMSESTTCLI